MRNRLTIKPPFFEIGPKNYLFGEEILKLAFAADKASEKYDVDILFTTPYADIRTVSKNTKSLHIFAPHMDCDPVGLGLANILPESLKAAGAIGVMLNHTEKPLGFEVLNNTIKRANELNLVTNVCADSVKDIQNIARLNPYIITAEPAELIASRSGVNLEYASEACRVVREINPNIYVLIGAGIKDGGDVYNAIMAGADASGSSSGIVKAENPISMMNEMVGAVRQAWNDRQKRQKTSSV